MIREHSTVRLRKDARLGFVCDFDEDAVGDLDDSSCVRTIEIFEPAKPYDEWERIDCFIADLDEVIEAEGCDREDICSDFEFMLIENHWTEDTPPERYYTIWIVREGDAAKAWLRRGFKSSFELTITLSTSKTNCLKRSIEKSDIHSWGHSYRAFDWRIGSNAWGITLIKGDRKVATSGDDAYHHGLKGLCEDLRELGLPVAFWENHGLEYKPLRVKERRRILAENRSERK